MVQKTLQPFTLSDTQMQEVLMKAEGSPLFLEELTRQVLEHLSEDALQTLPDTVQSVIASHLDRLPSTAKQLLQTAAVIGKDVPFAWLRALLALPETEMTYSLAMLQHSELLHETAFFPERLYAFHHDLTQEVT